MFQPVLQPLLALHWNFCSSNNLSNVIIIIKDISIMPRPLRILFPNACYHVMNRGSGRQKIFKNNFHRMMFLDLLEESHKMFGLEIFAYCLMDNHYHLLVSTPDANLSRIMRHINGVYTQRYNRLLKTDGSLFRGRYRAKLIGDDSFMWGDVA